MGVCVSCGEELEGGEIVACFECAAWLEDECATCGECMACAPLCSNGSAHDPDNFNASTLYAIKYSTQGE